jgi:hypothetical protein
MWCEPSTPGIEEAWILRVMAKLLEERRQPDGRYALWGQQAKRLTELSRSDDSRADALEGSLVLVLTRLQPSATRFSFPNHELRSTRSTPVAIESEALLDP